MRPADQIQWAQKIFGHGERKMGSGFQTPAYVEEKNESRGGKTERYCSRGESRDREDA